MVNDEPKDKLEKFWRKHHELLSSWLPFASVVLLVFWLFSDGDFSFILTLSSLVNMFSFLMVVLKIELGKTCKGVSLRMMECYLVLTIARLVAIVPFEGYLPYDRSGDWLYQVVEAASLCLIGTIVFLCRRRYHWTYEKDFDVLNHLYLIIPCAVFALLFHPSLNAFTPSDMCWAFALYVESVASLPQLVMFQQEAKDGHPVTPWTVHFLAAQVVSKVASFIFWVTSFNELSHSDSGHKAYVGHWVVIMQLIQLAVMGDFIYQCVRCIRRGVPVSELLAEHV